MARNRRPRLSWFRFFVDDFQGGISALSAQEVGQYVLLLCAQWASKDAQIVPPDIESMTLICRGVKPSAKVLQKFEEAPNGLRNKRLAEEWADSKKEYEGKSRRSKSADSAPDTAPDTGAVSVPEPQPQPQVQQTTTTPRARGRTVDRAEEETKAHVRKLQLTLAEKLVALSEHENSRLMIPAWCKRVTSYDKSQGVSDYRMISSAERLEKSISDADWWMSQLQGGRKVG